MQQVLINIAYPVCPNIVEKYCFLLQILINVTINEGIVISIDAKYYCITPAVLIFIGKYVFLPTELCALPNPLLDLPTYCIGILLSPNCIITSITISAINRITEAVIKIVPLFALLKPL